MSEPHDPRKYDIGEFDVDLKKAILAEALGSFSTKVLADDMLFQAIATTLRSDETIGVNEDDLRTHFGITPNIQDGRYRLSIEETARIHGGEIETEGGDVGFMHFMFSTMKYVPICEVVTKDDGKRGIVVDQPFVELALGRDVASEAPSQEETVALETAVRTVLGGVNEIVAFCDQRGVEVVIDKFGRPQLFEEAENTFYSSD